MNDLKDKNIIVTGASGGIGYSIVKKLNESGANILASGTRTEKLDELKKEFERINISKFDISQSEKIEEFIENATKELGGSLDCIVNNAGITQDNLAIRMSFDEWKKVIDVNVNGVFLSAQTFAKNCVKHNKTGNIVITASTLGIVAANSRCAYTTSKHATIGLTKQLAMDLAKNNIRVNAVAPGVIRTPLTERYFQDKEVAKKINGIHAMNRVGEPEEVSNAVRFLASDESTFCTGSILTVDGGWTAGKFM